MMRAVLFDLDGTLLHVDTAQFVDAYVQLLARSFAERIPLDRFVRQLLAATQAAWTQAALVLLNSNEFVYVH